MKIKFIIGILVLIEFFLIILLISDGSNFQLLNPQGSIAREQRNLMFLVIGILLVVAIPLLSAIYYFAFKYRDGKKAKYEPDAEHSLLFQVSWWVIPGIFIFILAIITWQKTHALDPYKPMDSSLEPMRIQVVALDWKWLFIYPDYDIATVNFVQFPKDTPVAFELTADAPMNSFWIPSLAGQIYAMTGMSTKLHVMADKIGDYRGQAAEINGKGFSGMKFVVRVSTEEEFDVWVGEVKKSTKILDSDEYEKLAQESINEKPFYYSSAERGLYDRIIMKYMENNAIQSNH